MATTTKTLTPTNQTITLPDMTERPNASVLVDGISKEADAINALNSKISDFEFGQTATDADNLTTGMRYLGSSSGHIPTSHAYYILTFENTGDNGAQMAIRRNASGYIYFRSKSSGTWGSWYQVTANVVS